MHNFQSWQIALPNKLLEFLQPYIGANLVGDLHVERWIIAACVGIERGLEGVISNGLVWTLSRERFRKLPIIAQSQSLLNSRIPKISRSGLIHVPSVV